MSRNRRVLGEETLTFTDGESKEYKIHAVSNYEMMKLRRQYRKTILDGKGNIKDVFF